MVSVVIPAYNEAETIGRVIKEIAGHPKVLEIIVVDDGSKDETSKMARTFGAKVITLEKNVGKAMAMDAGVKEAQSDVILFTDGDVYGLTYEKISAIVDPVLEGKYDMFVAIRARNTVILNKVLRFFPLISGERAIRKELWSKVPDKVKKGFQIEIALNFTAKQLGNGMSFALVPGIFQVIKEKKYGFWRGFWGRLKMIAEVIWVSIRLYILRMY